jgi:hypothetical protein
MSINNETAPRVARNKEFNKELTVLVTSCDAYRDVETPFLRLFRKYWSDCPFEVVLVAETQRENIDTSLSFDRVISTGFGKNWCQMLAEALENITTPYVLMLMNDYLLDSPVDIDVIRRRLSQILKFDAANLRLNPNPPGQIKWQDTDLLEYPKNIAYCVTCQTGIWNRNYLLNLAKRNKSAWEFERYGSFMVGDEKRPLLVTPTKEFPFVDAVHKGCWEKFGVEVCKRNGIELDFSVRGLPSLKVRVREWLKGLVFAIFPWTLIVRIQNLFDIGMKEKTKVKS